MKLCAIEPKELEEKILIRFAENQNDELLEDLSDYVINSQKEIERLKTDKEQLTSLVNSCQEEIRKLKSQLQQKENIIKGLDKQNKELGTELSLTIDKYEKKLFVKENIIKEVREYIENNSLYEEDYDYDYEENLVVGPPSDETARKILLEILDKGGELMR